MTAVLNRKLKEKKSDMKKTFFKKNFREFSCM